MTFEPRDRRVGFCSPAHQTRFHDVMARRGKVSTAFLLAWRQGKRGRTEDSAYALQQLSMMADKWCAEDKASGRRSDLIVTRKRAAKWSAVDLT
jgi:hypothetical protein